MGFYCRVSPYIIVGILFVFGLFLYFNGANINDIFKEIFDVVLRR